MNEQCAFTPNDLIANNQLTANAKKAYMVISVNYFGKEVEYKLGDLATEMGISKKGLSKVINKLEQLGYIKFNSKKGRYSIASFEIVNHPSKCNISYTKIERSRIYSCDSDLLELYAKFKMIYNISPDKKVESFIKANCSISPWYSISEVFDVANTLTQCNMIDFKYKISMIDEDTKKEAEPKTAQPTTTFNYNINKPTKNITEKPKFTEDGLPIVYKEDGEIDYYATRPWMNNADWKQAQTDVDYIGARVKKYEMRLAKGEVLSETDQKILNFSKEEYENAVAITQKIEAAYRKKLAGGN